jgi:uncharacterized integral membrane protein
MEYGIEGDKAKEQRIQQIDKWFAITVAGVLILLSIFFIIVDVTTLEIFHVQRIFGPGAFPIAIFFIMIVLCGWLIMEVVTGKGSSAELKEHIEFRKIKKALRLFGLILIAIFLMSFIGFVFAMMIFTFLEMKFLSEKNVKLPYIIICTVVLPVSIYAIFKSLQIQLPMPYWLLF